MGLGSVFISEMPSVGPKEALQMGCIPIGFLCILFKKYIICVLTSSGSLRRNAVVTASIAPCADRPSIVRLMAFVSACVGSLSSFLYVFSSARCS